VDLEAQGVAQRLEGVLGGVVPAPARKRQPAAHGADHDDPPPALSPHRRQDQLGQPHRAEDVGLELPAGVGQRHGLDGPRPAEAGVVDQDPDCAVLLLDHIDGGPHGIVVGHVERQGPAAERFEVGEDLGPAGGGVDRPSRTSKKAGGGPPDAARTAGDQYRPRFSPAHAPIVAARPDHSRSD
jgi:hypothetical protein